MEMLEESDGEGAQGARRKNAASNRARKENQYENEDPVGASDTYPTRHMSPLFRGIIIVFVSQIDGPDPTTGSTRSAGWPKKRRSGLI